jgi:mRNA interferase MazF
VKRGEIVLTILPFTDLSGQKRRPALLISPDTRPGDDVIVAFITRYLGQPLLSTDVSVLDTDPDFGKTILKLSSVIKADKLFTIHKNLILGKVAELIPRMMQNVDQALCLALGL